jgi:hypothetical protein
MLQDADEVLIGPYWVAVRRLNEPPDWARLLGCAARVVEDVEWLPYSAVNVQAPRRAG